MSELSVGEFQNLARLARLDPDDESLAGLRADFNRILDHVNRFRELDGEGGGAEVELPVADPLRADVPGPRSDPAAVSRLAPDWESGHFVVPGVLESEG